VFKANKKAGLIQNKQGYFFTLKYRKWTGKNNIKKYC
jgi:hypothetical protein